MIKRFLSSGRLFNNILETIGGTPVVRLNKIAPKHITVFVKCEFFNPLGSVKDRLGLAVILDAEEKGILKPGSTVIEATSGNTGIALAMVCAQRGYDLVICMPDSFSVERRRIMRALGAKVILTPATVRGTGVVKKAEELAEKHGWFLVRQFDNEANPRFHASTTGPEILQDFAGKRLDYWITGYGTGGTFSGAGKVLKAARPDLKIMLSEPNTALLVSSGLKQPRDASGSYESHPAAGPHIIQGWTSNFIPSVLEQGLDEKVHDGIIPVSGDESIAAMKKLAQQEGIFTGISGGASTAAALKLANDPSTPKGSVILTMLPDTGERYLSTSVFEDITAEMNEEELTISKSTPFAQLE
jgi:cysteine synthase A